MKVALRLKWEDFLLVFLDSPLYILNSFLPKRLHIPLILLANPIQLTHQQVKLPRQFLNLIVNLWHLIIQVLLLVVLVFLLSLSLRLRGFKLLHSLRSYICMHHWLALSLHQRSCHVQSHFLFRYKEQLSCFFEMLV